MSLYGPPQTIKFSTIAALRLFRKRTCPPFHRLEKDLRSMPSLTGAQVRSLNNTI